MKAKTKVHRDEMRAEYDIDYSKAVRGKYYKRLIREGSNVVLLDPDIAKAFRTSKEVNEALRSLLEIVKATRRAAARSNTRTKKRRTQGQ